MTLSPTATCQVQRPVNDDHGRRHQRRIAVCLRGAPPERKNQVAPAHTRQPKSVLRSMWVHEAEGRSGHEPHGASKLGLCFGLRLVPPDKHRPIVDWTLCEAPQFGFGKGGKGSDRSVTGSSRAFIFSVENAVCKGSRRRQCRRNRLLRSLPILTSVRSPHRQRSPQRK